MRYFIIAGEASGDLHGSNLMRELKEVDPKAQFCFLGGDLMSAQGGELIKHYREMAFMGFVNVLRNAGKVIDNMNLCKKSIVAFKPDVVILIDYPSFNLRIAEFVKKNIHIPVYYYISPKLWAWKEFRIKSIKKYVDNMFTIFPFETEFYKKHGYEVEYVGNPSVDSIASRPMQDESFNNFCNANDIDNTPIIALLPGSRKQEIRACLPTMLEAAKNFDRYQIVVTGAPGVSPDFYNEIADMRGVKIVFDQTYRLLSQSDAAIVNSGTATLETALIGTPQIVVYQLAMSRVAMMLKPILIKTKYVSLVNIIAGKEVVTELLGHHFTAENLTKELRVLLNDSKRLHAMKEDYRAISALLGKPGAAIQAAKSIFNHLKTTQKETALSD